MEEKFVKVNELLKDSSFIEELKTAENDEDVQKLFAAKGIDLSLDEIAQMVQESIAAHEKGELDEESLENVSGGVIGLLCLGAGAIAFFAGYGYRALTKYR